MKSIVGNLYNTVVRVLTLVGMASGLLIFGCKRNPADPPGAGMQGPRDHGHMMMGDHGHSMMGDRTGDSADASRSEWKAKASADTLKNPFAGSAEATARGKATYAGQCAVCHGDEGKGNGVASQVLDPKPADLTSAKVQDQKDGALFWKITTGRGPMPAFGATLSEPQRWQVVDYIRKLGGREEKKTEPNA